MIHQGQIHTINVKLLKIEDSVGFLSLCLSFIEANQARRVADNELFWWGKLNSKGFPFVKIIFSEVNLLYLPVFVQWIDNDSSFLVCNKHAMHQRGMSFDIANYVTFLLMVHPGIVDDVGTEDPCFPVQNIDVSWGQGTKDEPMIIWLVR